MTMIDALIEMTKQEENILKEFLTALTSERDAIISFSLDGIVAGNNKKEQILKKLEYLKKEKEKLFDETDDREAIESNKTLRMLNADLTHIMKDVRTAMDKNMKLLSFSIDHVRTSIENIIGTIGNPVGYGKKAEDISSFVLSKVV